jgi:transglutaminase-like putative cysteine protease
MRSLWQSLQDASFSRRATAKAIILTFTTLVVLFPYPNVLLRHLQRWRDPNALIQPDAPSLQPLIAELTPRLENIPPGPQVLNIVEKFVYDKIPYAWDWDTWGVADYIPTVDEAVTAAGEDCDGRAVISASLLRNFGYTAEIVSDLTHVWVKTDRGETMSPGKGRKAIETEDGKVKVHWDAIANIPRSTAYGIAVFPLWRELIVLAVYFALAMRQHIHPYAAAAAAVLLLDGLFLIRLAGANAWNADLPYQLLGLGNLIAGGILLHIAHARARRHSLAAESLLNSPA